VLHANARSATRGRALLVRRVIHDGRPVGHFAKELRVSRQCANRLVSRFRAEGGAGLHDRSAERSGRRREPAQTVRQPSSTPEPGSGSGRPCWRPRPALPPGPSLAS